MKKEIYIIEGLRTAIGSFGGSLSGISASSLGTSVVRTILEKTKIDPKKIEAIVMGNVLNAGDVHNPARIVGFNCGTDDDCAAYSVNRLCGSGMQATINAIMEIETENAGLAIAVGAESMSRFPNYLTEMKSGKKYGPMTLIDGVAEVLSDPMDKYPAGILGENCASEYGISREEQDIFALQSQEKAAFAIANGYFSEQIVPIEVGGKIGTFKIDEHPKNTTLEKLGTLKPAFKKDGTVTAGNASGINDGAAAIFLADEKTCKDLNQKPLARILSYAQAGNNHNLMGFAPVLSSQKALAKAGLTIDDMDLIEINEAFAAQVLACEKGLKWDRSKVNVNGGAVALGHPLGMSGVRVIVMLMHELRRRKAQYGLATICIGGGMGLSVIIENLDR